jgi:HlyD family secretion protein
MRLFVVIGLKYKLWAGRKLIVTKNRRKKIIFSLAAIAIIGLLFFLYLTNLSDRNNDTIVVSGNIEVTDVQISFKIPGRVETRLVDEGQLVTRGQIVAELDKTDLIQEMEIRRSELTNARSVLAELEAGSRPQEIAAAAAAVEAARAELLDAESNYSRLNRLKQQDVAGVQEYITAKARFDAAGANLRNAEERYSLVKEGPRKETIDQAKARVAQAEAALELAKVRLDYATLRSPLTGVVLSENIESGEYVVSGTPVVTVGDLINVWLRAYINETDLGRVKHGQKVRVTTDTYPGKIYEGYVSFISSEAEFTPKNVQTQEQRVKLVYRIKVDIQNPQMELKAGMPADAEILLNAQGEL